MDYQLYENANDLLNDNPNNSKISWNLTNDSSMDDNSDEYFSWNTLKIDENQLDERDDIDDAKNHEQQQQQRKRKTTNYDVNKVNKLQKIQQQQQQIGKYDKRTKKESTQNGNLRMASTWQVEDISDLNGDIDSSLSLDSDLATNSYNVGDSILSISGLTVFKQEAPSPTSTDVGQVNRQNQCQSPTSTSVVIQQQQHVPNNNNNNIRNLDDNANNQTMINNTISQLLTHNAYTNLQSTLDVNLVATQPAPQPPPPQSVAATTTTAAITTTPPLITNHDNYSNNNNNVTSTNYSFTEDCRFQYVLAAATSIATKINEDTLTYLNQGQSYEIKLKKLGDLSMYRGKLLKSVIRICFHERRLQYMEKEQMISWQRARPGDRILEVDVPLSYGTFDIVQPQNALNIIQFSWDPTKEVGIYIKVNCISTEFTPKKHGGEKGVPFRIQVETYQNGDNLDSTVRLHAAACQIKVFKLKGADRKHKQDREKIMKRPISEQEKYQPSYECTVLNDIPNDAVLNTPPVALIATVESSSGGGGGGQNQTNFRTELLSSSSSIDNNNPSPKCETQQPQQQQQQQHNGISSTPPVVVMVNERKIENDNELHDDQLVPYSTPQQTLDWLIRNRFEKYLQTFESFSGADMLRMSRDDLIQICGQADGIRLYNSLHLKAIAPKLKIYVCRENTPIFNAIFLSTHSYNELIMKLSNIMGINQEQVRDIYLEGPQSIHIQLNNDVIKHIKEETMFSIQILQENGGTFVFILKKTVK